MRSLDATQRQKMQKQSINPALLQFARAMRHSPTSAENFLWQVLRARQFAGLKFRRQHPVEPYILDFYCPEIQLAVEVDGAQHANVKGMQDDAQRTAYLAEKGIKLIRFWNHEVMTQPEHVLNHLWNIVRELNENIHPTSTH